MKRLTLFPILGCLLSALLCLPLTATAKGGYKSVSAGHGNVMVLKEDGTLWGWGLNAHGELGDGSTTNRKRPVKILDGVRQVSAGDFCTMAILDNGTLWGWGSNGYGELGDGSITNRNRPIKIAEGVRDVACGNSYTIYITKDGELMECGRLDWW